MVLMFDCQPQRMRNGSRNSDDVSKLLPNNNELDH